MIPVTNWAKGRAARAGSCALVALGLVLVHTREARAFERQQNFGVDGGFTLLQTQNNGSNVGGGFAFHYTYGLSDAINLCAETQYSILAQQNNPSSPRDVPGYVGSATIGAQYVFDVLRWVPYVGALAGPYMMGGGTISGESFQFGAQVEAGLDYQITRSFAIGAAYHEHFMLTAMSTYPLYFNVFARAEYIWGW